MQSKLSENPLTTVSGGILQLAGTLLVLVPAEVREPCMAAVAASENPVIVGALLGSGMLLTFVGPTLMKNGKALGGPQK
jgi:hypothetical protein